MKVVINKCYGGFSLSKEAYEALGEKWDGYGFVFEISRADPKLVAVVEKLGCERASGSLAKLAVVEIPDGVEWSIEEYDGIEWIAEEHRTWR